MKVLKFGGSSVGSPDRINQIKEILVNAPQKEQVIVVVSAMGGVTDQLIAIGNLALDNIEESIGLIRKIKDRHIEAIKELGISDSTRDIGNYFDEILSIANGIRLLGEFSPRTRDKLVGYGEMMSSFLISSFLKKEGHDVRWVDSRKLIKTDHLFGSATVDFMQTNFLTSKFFKENSHHIYLAPGFIGSTSEGTPTTLGRGGSDYTAAIFAAALDAPVCEIWTDVSGMMTADPRIVPNAKIIDEISYEEAFELSTFGAKVIYPPTILPLKQKGIPVLIKNTFAPADKGTLIKPKTVLTDEQVRGISAIGDIVMLNLQGSGLAGVPGTSARVFTALQRANVNIILISQGSSEQSICVAFNKSASQAALDRVGEEFKREIADGHIESPILEEDLSILALVGDQMKNHPGISGRMFRALGRNGVNVRAIAQGSSEKNISVVIRTIDSRKAINVLHEAFFGSSKKEINLYIAGLGNVGKRLLSQLEAQIGHLSDKHRINLKVVGLVNSRKMLFNEQGISLEAWQVALENGQPSEIADFTDEIVAKNLRNSVFVDITSDGGIVEHYAKLLQKSISVVACNKIACSSELQLYKRLKSLASEFNTSFLFETNVGAALPILSTLNDLRQTGDQVHKIKAVLSGTLNFVFNHYDGSDTFSSIVAKAQEEGYTEPDPRLDLSGMDVARKLLILIRESGYDMEMSEIECRGFLPSDCTIGTVGDFYEAMTRREPHFKMLYENAQKKGSKLKVVATFEDGKASVGLEEISGNDELFNLSGKDNVVLFYTNRYPEQPLMIKGAGAGAEVTASGIFADIMRAAKR